MFEALLRLYRAAARNEEAWREWREGGPSSALGPSLGQFLEARLDCWDAHWRKRDLPLRKWENLLDSIQEGWIKERSFKGIP